MAAMERRLRGGGGDAVRLPAVAQRPLRPRDGRDLRRPRLDLPRARPEGRADHAGDRRRHAVDHAPELTRLPVSVDAEHARPAVVVSGDAGLLLPVVDRGRHRARDPHRYVDREGMAPPARDHAARLGRTDHVLGAPRLPRVSPWRHGDPQPALRSLRRQPRPGLRGRDLPRWRASAHPAGPQVASAAPRRALRRVAARGCGRGVQPHERRALRDDVPGPDALGRTGELHAVDRRVGRVDRPDRRDDLPVRPGGPSHAGSLPGGAQRRTLSR